ncbi:glycosyltransferase family 2 protein [candidate division WOR-3 bacterium]|nr:glycosyltransferase family 2 protein [candidate division WOR-3 bacterium]
MEKIGAKRPEGPHNFIEKRNLTKIIEFLDFSISYSGYMLLFPKYIPLLSFLANTIGVKIWEINKFSFVQYMILHPLPKNENDFGFGCSVIIPCYNEAENIEEVVKRIPKMGKETEIIVVNDGSKDETADIVKKLKKHYQNLKLIDYSPNKGKGFAVKKGFDAATQEIVMILDADMSAPPEELPRFFNLLNKGICDFVNGTRMVYPMQEQSMRFLNLLGNKIFALVMTFITGQHLTDTLCGTKAMYKKDYQHIRMGLDKWGDFDLLFGTVKLGNKIMEMPVHYMARRAGESKMRAFTHGFHLLRASFRGFKELVLADRSPG